MAQYKIGDKVGIDIFGLTAGFKGRYAKNVSGVIKNIEDTDVRQVITVETEGMDRKYYSDSIYRAEYIANMLTHKVKTFSSNDFNIKNRIVLAARGVDIDNEITRCKIFDHLNSGEYISGEEIIECVDEYEKANPYDADIRKFRTDYIDCGESAIKADGKYKLYVMHTKALGVASANKSSSVKEKRAKDCERFTKMMNDYIENCKLNNEECNIALYNMITDGDVYTGREIRQAVKDFITTRGKDPLVDVFEREFIHCVDGERVYGISNDGKYILKLSKYNLIAVREDKSYASEDRFDADIETDEATGSDE